MIVAIGSDKGTPGATTLATVLALAWPGDCVVCELDPRGADLPYRLKAADGDYMRAAPSIIGLAVDSRPGTATPRLEAYAQQTALGISVIRGEVTTRATNKVAPHLPALAAVAAAWPGTVLADLGSLQPSNPGLAVAKAAAIVLLVVRATPEGLGHLRSRVEELAEYVGDPSRERTSVGVVLVADAREEGRAIEHAQAVLNSIGSPASVVGVLAHDPAAVALLWDSQWTKKLTKSALVRSGEKLISRLWQLWPDEMTSVTWKPAGLDAAPQVGVMP